MGDFISRLNQVNKDSDECKPSLCYCITNNGQRILIEWLAKVKKEVGDRLPNYLQTPETIECSV